MPPAERSSHPRGSGHQPWRRAFAGVDVYHQVAVDVAIPVFVEVRTAPQPPVVPPAAPLAPAPPVELPEIEVDFFDLEGETLDLRDQIRAWRRGTGLTLEGARDVLNDQLVLQESPATWSLSSFHRATQGRFTRGGNGTLPATADPRYQVLATQVTGRALEAPETEVLLQRIERVQEVATAEEPTFPPVLVRTLRDALGPALQRGASSPRDPVLREVAGVILRDAMRVAASHARVAAFQRALAPTAAPTGGSDPAPHPPLHALLVGARDLRGDLVSTLQQLPEALPQGAAVVDGAEAAWRRFHEVRRGVVRHLSTSTCDEGPERANLPICAVLGALARS